MIGLLAMLGIILGTVIIMSLGMIAICAVAAVYLVSEIIALITGSVFRLVRFWNRRPYVRSG